MEQPAIQMSTQSDPEYCPDNKGLTEAFSGKRVLVTGHTGFKGSWLAIWLMELGAKVIGFALAPTTSDDNFVVSLLEKRLEHIIGDVRDYNHLKQVFDRYQPEIVFHLAAQPIVLESYAHPKETMDVNVGGSVNVLECCRLTDSVHTIVLITSDKCYANNEWVWSYRENDPLGGSDPYSASKGCAELLATAYDRSFFSVGSHGGVNKCLATVRAGNVIGGGDWQQYRIVPDCIRALRHERPVAIRNPKAVRPWQHVLDPLHGYLCLARKMSETPLKFRGAWNFGPGAEALITVGRLVEKIARHWPNGKWIEDTKHEAPHEAGILRIDSTKAMTCLGWRPIWDIDTAIEKTVQWYLHFEDTDPFELCLEQIRNFSARKGDVP